MLLRLYYSKHFSDMLQIVFPFFSPMNVCLTNLMAIILYQSLNKPNQ